MGEVNREEGKKMAANAVATSPGPALEDIFREHNERVFRAAYRITGNASDAEDVLQTVFLRLVRQGWSAEPIASVGSYLHRAAVNAALDVVRSRRDGQKIPLEDLEPVLSDDARLRPDRCHSAEELRARLRRALAKLSPKAAEIFALRYFEGFDNPEIARMLGTSLSNVAVTLHRTRSELQTKLHSYGDWL